MAQNTANNRCDRDWNDLRRTSLLLVGQLSIEMIERRTRHCFYGAGIGYPPTWIDNLRIKMTDTHILKPGMTFMIHGILADWDAEIAVALGDPVLVADSGMERLTTLNHELVVRR